MCLSLSQLTIVTSLNILCVFIDRNYIKFFKYLFAITIQCVAYYGFLNSLGYVDFDELNTGDASTTIIGSIFGVIAWIFISEVTLIKIETDIINNFKLRIEY